jgi:hypothetical protein
VSQYIGREMATMRTTWSTGAKNPRNRIPCAHRACFFVQNLEVARTQGVAVPSLDFFHLQLATMEESGIGVGKGRPGERAGGRLGGGGCTRSPEHTREELGKGGLTADHGSWMPAKAMRPIQDQHEPGRA